MTLFIFLFMAMLCGCQSGDGTTSFTGNAMTMQYKIVIGQDLPQPQADLVEGIIQKTFHETNAIFNKWNPDSELSKLNRLKACEASPLSAELLRLFNETDRIVVLSQGKFDPTIEPLQNLWKQKLKSGKIPSDEEIQEIAPAIGWNKISFADGAFKKEHDKTQLDFGGIAKGLCIDIIVERLKEAGFNDLYVEWGGEIRTAGNHPQGRLWTIFISRLGDTDPDNAIATVPLMDQAIATSGDYLQNWTVDQKTYFHIFDPATLRPLEATPTSIASASVAASNCALADGLATIAMMFPTVAEAQAWADTIKEKYPETTFWIEKRLECGGLTPLSRHRPDDGTRMHF
jgi:FAD:protein FMN transferase